MYIVFSTNRHTGERNYLHGIDGELCLYTELQAVRECNKLNSAHIVNTVWNYRYA